MNNHEREERRKLQERRDESDALAKAMPNINRAHRDCERECLDLKARIKALESLLARAGDRLIDCLSNYIPFDDELFQSCTDVVNEIDAILPATEGKKDE